MATYVVFCSSIIEGATLGLDEAGAETHIDVHRMNGSMWLIDTRLSPSQIVDHLRPHIASGAMLWVSELTSVRSYNQALGGTGDWLARHRPDR